MPPGAQRGFGSTHPIVLPGAAPPGAELHPLGCPEMSERGLGETEAQGGGAERRHVEELGPKPGGFGVFALCLCCKSTFLCCCCCSALGRYWIEGDSDSLVAFFFFFFQLCHVGAVKKSCLHFTNISRNKLAGVWVCGSGSVMLTGCQTTLSIHQSIPKTSLFPLNC